jgi:PPE-repeat protein
VIDFGALPPEINSTRMYAGPGPFSLSVAAMAWDSMAAELHAAASSYRTVIKGLTTERWLGPSSLAMASAFGPYVAWTAGLAARAEDTASQAKLAVEAFEAAFTMTVPPPAVTANRVQLMSLIATNLAGQNSAAIAANEAEYSEMWAQDAAAMYQYAANSAAATELTPFTEPPHVASEAGVIAQDTSVSNAVSRSGTQNSSLTNIVSSMSDVIKTFAAPDAGSSDVTTTLGGLSSALSDSGFSVGGLAQGIISSYANLAGFAVIFTGLDALAPLMNPDVFLPFMNMGAAAAPVAEGAAAAVAPAALGSGFAGGLGGFAGLGQAASVGGMGMSVPPSWGWAAAGPMSALMGGVPLAGPLTGAALGVPGGMPMATGLPMMMGGLPRAAAAGAIGGALAAKYSPRLTAVARTPAGGYAPAPEGQNPMAYPMPGAGFPPPAPGYTPAIVYLPTNAAAPAEV